MVKRKIISLLIFALLLISGCSLQNGKEANVQYIEKPIEVKVPVLVKPDIKIPNEPEYPIKSLTKNSSNKEVVEAYYKTVFMQRDYIVLLRRTLEKLKE